MVPAVLLGGTLLAKSVFTVVTAFTTLVGVPVDLPMPATPVPPSQPPAAGLQVNPSSVVAGTSIRLTASCSDSNTASASSEAFATVNMSPAASGGVLYADAIVRAGTAPGIYTATAACGNGAKLQNTFTVYVAPSQGPATGGGGLAATTKTPMVASGVILVAAGLGMGLLALRRRRA